ncbi:MAG: transporter, partial [Dermabacter sp.]|nr:transporter [Dermabacter sp.]
ALGSAAGPLVVGLILGRWEHTGPILWTLPRPVNLTIRQLGLSVFLAAVGVISGPSFAENAFTLDGLKVALVAAASLMLMLPLVPVAGALLGVSLERSAGAVAAFVGQSVVLEHALNLGHDDERTASGYAAVYALGIVVQLLLVQFMVT